MNKFLSAIRSTFGNKKFKYGGYALLITLAGIAVVVLLNVGLTVLENNFDLRIDMSQNKKYTLTDQTKKIVGDLQKDIYVYTLYTPGGEDSQVSELLRKYKGLSGHVIVENHDPDTDPRFMQTFSKENQSIAAGSIIVSDADHKFFRVLGQTDIYQYEYKDANNPTQATGLQIVAEGSITQAINYIASGFIPTIYVAEGHGELGISDLYYAQQVLEQENYQLETVNLTKEPNKVKAGDLLMFIAPASDLTDDEYNLLRPLMDKGGRFYFFFDPLKMNGKSMPNFESLLKLYDISLKKGLVYEGNTSYMISSTKPLMITPKVETHTVTSGVASSRMGIIVNNSGAIGLPEVPPESSMTITPLLESSPDSYIKPDVVEAPTKSDTDEQGPFTLMAAVEKKNGAAETDATRFIVAYNTDFLTNQQLVTYSSNIYLLMDGAAWMRNAEKDIYIRGKTVSSEVLGFKSAFERIAVIVVACFLIPVLLLAGGIVVYLRRKHL